MAFVKKETKTGKYRGFFKDYEGKRKSFTGTKNKKQTQKEAEQLEEHHSLIKMGLMPKPSIANINESRPFDDVVKEYFEWGTSKGGLRGNSWDEVHFTNTKFRLNFFKEKLQLDMLSDVYDTLSVIEQEAKKLKDGRYGKPLAGKTVEDYVGTLRTFCNWCIKKSYLTKNPVDGYTPYDTTPVTSRRAGTVEEIKLLLKTCATHRRVLYEVAFCCCLRANELRQLTVNHLDVKKSGLWLDPKWNKSRKKCFRLLPRIVTNSLVNYIESGDAQRLYDEKYKRKDANKSKIPEKPLLYVPTHTARELYKDLETAGIPKITPEGLFCFHASRNSYITILLDLGVNPKIVQELAGHERNATTMGIYAKSRYGGATDAVEGLGSLIFDEDDGENNSIENPENT